jgi:hypothetical protein
VKEQELIHAFELGAIDGAEFPHERHVRVARGLAQRYGRDDGLLRLIAGIRAMAARAGHPEAYHETITRAWYELIISATDVERAPELFDKQLLSRYYSAGRLAVGRDRWLEPDLYPLRLPPPSSSAAPFVSSACAGADATDFAAAAGRQLLRARKACRR